MSGHRRGLVGKGYMPKGGVPAAVVHNEVVRARVGTGLPPVPESGAAGPDVRASARLAWWYGFGVGAVGSAASSIVACLVVLR